jgi:hypothetical protein
VSDEERLLLDYRQTSELVQSLTDVRFKLLALVPTLSGVAVAVLGHPSAAVELLAVGALGLTATLGLLLYELRNSALNDYAVARARELEASIGFVSIRRNAPVGGPFRDFPERGGDRGFALVYGAALSGWSYLVAWGILRALDLSRARPVGAAIGAAVGLLVVVALVRVRSQPGVADATGDRELTLPDVSTARTT